MQTKLETVSLVAAMLPLPVSRQHGTCYLGPV